MNYFSSPLLLLFSIIVESVNYLKKAMGEDKEFNYSLRDCVYGKDYENNNIIFGFTVYKNDRESDIQIAYISNLDSKKFQAAIVSMEGNKKMDDDFLILSMLVMASFEPEFRKNTDLALEVLYDAADGYRKYNDYLFMFVENTFSIQPKDVIKTWFE